MTAPFDPASCLSSDADLAVLRRRIEDAVRQPEAEALAPLIDGARFSELQAVRISARAESLAATVRSTRRRATGVDALMNEFSLDSNEGVALMCLAEALLRIPDAAGRDALIRDKLRYRDWAGHVGHSPSLFVNAAAWSLALSGRLLTPDEERRMPGALLGLLQRSGGALLREAMERAMRLVGQQFVVGETIREALERTRSGPAANYLYSFDMLGEAAITGDDATRYATAYAQAIHAVGEHGRWHGVQQRNGISIKLSALHPRFGWAQHRRVMRELVPRVRQLCLLAKAQDIGLTIDAEESDRLELSLDVLAALVADPALAGWAGLGFVVQAYQKRAPALIDWLVALARRHRRRLMVRLVKGAYWDGEIKRAQQDGLTDYPVYTRKAHTDLAYLACVRALLAAPDALFPLFATHNAHTVAAVLEMGGSFRPGDYEFQCLHGMGETLFGQLVQSEEPSLRRPVRVYAPVGSHAGLLAYLVRRLLENGANSSFVNQVVDEAVPLTALVADPVDGVLATGGSPHPQIPLPADLYTGRRNSRGFDLAAGGVRRAFLSALERSREETLHAEPRIGAALAEGADRRLIHNPAQLDEVVGAVRWSSPSDVDVAVQLAAAQAPGWSVEAPEQRALCLERTALALEARSHALVALLVREAGKTVAAALGEVREAADFCRYYASCLRAGDLAGSRPLGPVVAISPWNFPLAIFVGQIAAALAAGNPVLAKPAEQTSLIADRAVALLHEAGVPRPMLQCLPGPGETIGAQLVADPRVRGVMFTGSTAVADAIHRQLAVRGDVALIAETGGLNAMIVDSTALPEQVVTDVLSSAFDSAGQRCSALRLLCVQEDIAAPVLELLDGAMAELSVGRPDDFATDVGPLIDAAARVQIDAYVDAMRANRYRVLVRSLPDGCLKGHFVVPTLIELNTPDELTREVFGPVLHVLRYAAGELDALLDALVATGYGLTLGIQSRVDTFVERIVRRMPVGNVYVNRNMIGAVVGVQPFGGEGLSGTGPKAGGPLSLRRLVQEAPPPLHALQRPPRPALDVLDAWLAGPVPSLPDAALKRGLCNRIAAYRQASLAGLSMLLPGPTGERNTLGFHARGAVLGLGDSAAAWYHQLVAALATDNRLLLPAEDEAAAAWLASLPEALRTWVEPCADVLTCVWVAVLADLPPEETARWRLAFANRGGPILPFLVPSPDYALERLVHERCVTVNTAATGGNTGLLRLGDV
ncbi:bifunctional proline dehydrogenase/L-glutamate gamma-semialdehyde dehydrogenase PutA [Zoogloea sp. LCSB751]|uniref:bifunctional proline dehydrogenase/L-glutamate gamma-semialdehyde dehydrogenase PutA n=1 Tax=Zoogloea sp. LCSB751 TaxID=1965277 RepID=UPI0009A49914|nr:bifunctional proline dehydrogenase/L-glutamate gamma-semialdehyde dehydrogenase PutA [Zoogloea sp. LCSB751]